MGAEAQVRVWDRRCAQGAGAGAEGGVVGRGDPDFEQESGESDGASPSSSSSSSDPSAREGSEEKVTTKVAAVTRKWLLV